MIAGQNKKTLGLLGVGLLVLGAVAFSLAERGVALALLAGYILFSINYILLARISAGLLVISQAGVPSSRMKAGLLFGTALKFLSLSAALYMLIVYWQLSGIYIAVGSLISLLLLTSLLVVSYMKSLGSASRL